MSSDLVTSSKKEKTCMEVYGWIACSFASAFCYTTFNTMTANYIAQDCYSAKVVNCMVLGFAALSYRAFLSFGRKEQVII